MSYKLSSLHIWLHNAGFHKEAEDLIKICAGNPLPIDREQVSDIVDELLEDFITKLLIFQLTPKDILGVIGGTLRFGRDNSIANGLYGKTTRNQLDVTGEEIEIDYILRLTDDPSAPAGAA